MERRPEPEYMDDDAEAEAYALTDFSEVNQTFVERLIEIAGPLEQARAVELGTGPGDIPVRVIAIRPSWHIVAVDASEAMLKFARGTVEKLGLSRSIDLLLGDAKETGLPAGAFDVVFSNSIIHHITEIDGLWAEVKRLAGVGGVIFLRDLARPADEAAAREIVKKYAADASTLLQEEYYRSLLSSYTIEEVRSQLNRAGLESLEVVMSSDRHFDVFGRIA